MPPFRSNNPFLWVFSLDTPLFCTLTWAKDSYDSILGPIESAADAAGVVFVRMEEEASVYRVKSGRYSFGAILLNPYWD